MIVADTIKITISNEEGEERKRIYNAFFHYSAARGKYVEARNMRGILNYSMAFYECRILRMNALAIILRHLIISTHHVIFDFNET